MCAAAGTRPHTGVNAGLRAGLRVCAVCKANRLVAAAAAPLAAARAAARGTERPLGTAAELSEVEQWALHLVNAEYARSKEGGWRRLFPSRRSAEYLPFLDAAHAFHRLPFDV